MTAALQDTKYRANMIISLYETDHMKDPRRRTPTTAAWLDLYEYFGDRLERKARRGLPHEEYRFTMPEGDLVIHGDMENGTFTTTVGNLDSREDTHLFWFLWRVIVHEYPATAIVFFQGQTTGRVKPAPWPLALCTLKPMDSDWVPGVSRCRIYPLEGE